MPSPNDPFASLQKKLEKTPPAQWMTPAGIAAVVAACAVLLLIGLFVVALVIGPKKGNSPTALSLPTIAGPASIKSDNGIPLDGPVFAHQVRELVGNNDIEFIAEMLTHKTPENRMLHQRVFDCAVEMKRAEVVAVVLKSIPIDCDPEESKLILSRINASVGYGMTADVLDTVLEHCSEIDPDKVDQRLRQSLQHGHDDVAEIAYEYLVSTDDGIAEQTWLTLAKYIQRDDQWDRWLPRIIALDAPWKSRVALEAIRKQLRDLPKDGFPDWWELSKDLDESQLKNIAYSAFKDRNRAIVLDISRREISSPFTAQYQLDDIREWDLEIWKNCMERLEESDLTAMWWRDLKSKERHQRLKDWGSWIHRVVNSVDPSKKRSSRPYDGLRFAFSQHDYKLALYLLENGATMPTGTPEPLEGLFLAIFDNDKRLLEARLQKLAIRSPDADFEETWSVSELDHLDYAFRVNGSKTQPYVDFNPIALAIQLGHPELVEALAAKIRIRDLQLLIDLAVEHDSWASIDALAANDISIPDSIVAQLHREDADKAAAVFGNVGNGLQNASAVALPKQLLFAIKNDDFALLESSLAQLTSHSDDYLRSAPNAALSVSVLIDSLQQEQKNATTVDEIISAAVGKSRFLERLLTEGFPLRKLHLIQAIQSQDLASIEVCVRATRVMSLVESDMNDIDKAVRLSPSEQVKDYFQRTGLVAN